MLGLKVSIFDPCIFLHNYEGKVSGAIAVRSHRTSRRRHVSRRQSTSGQEAACHVSFQILENWRRRVSGKDAETA